MPTTPKGFVYPDQTGHTRIWDHLSALALSVDPLVIGGITTTTFTSSGTWTKPTNTILVIAEVWAGGGSGSAAGGGAGQAAGGGGGAGGYSWKIYDESELGATEAVVVGAGGSGNGGAGNNGVASSFSVQTSNGGTCGASMATATGNALASNGVGGTASGGNKNFQGGDGGKGQVVGGIALFSNFGGGSAYGGGLAIFGGSVAAIGTAGKFPGGGGSGSFASAAGMNGPNGAAGRVQVVSITG